MGGDLRESRAAWRAVAAIAAVYALAMLAFYPAAITNRDESNYLRQALALTELQAHTPAFDPATGEEVAGPPSSLPIGTALFLAPLVALGGWRAAYAAPLLELLLSMFLLAHWLRTEGRSPLFALLLPAFVPLAVLGRVPTSDTLSLLCTTVGLFLFFRGLDGGSRFWLGSGLVAGFSLLVREPNVLIFAPFYLGALLRAERGVWALVVGGLVGVGLRIAANQWIHGDPLFYRVTGADAIGYGFGLAAVVQNLPGHALALLVLVPGGLLGGVLYRGRRWPELVSTVVLFTLFHLAYSYGAVESGGLKRLVLGLRFYIPLLPVLAIALAEWLPRAWSRLPESRRRALDDVVRIGAWAGVVALGVGLIATHALFARWSATQGEIAAAIYSNTPDNAVVVSDFVTSVKFMNGIYGPRRNVDLRQLSPEIRRGLLSRDDALYVVLLDRLDSTFMRARSRDNAMLVEALSLPEPLLDRNFAAERLRIWRISR
jgi:4-amino-4-deoxy-L-arabinose transferase-like glycosyltransferase